ncbi:VWA domain-containing protein [Dysgonomonas capnocytophagoides]|uniref:VWA domain-containing protein n=1 Tax=Dysgonomonas capnocytophagoides TaxID=45254 RepID=A0A4Y8KWV1_9BACT|nr:VWA domain-containing protein [Dysgonomonas capnocytophagoides]TFD93701.1 VWA domain-containing protein [Dysgonomonas capnocytophagoides]
MKKTLSFFLGIIILSSLSACNSGKKQQTENGSGTDSIATSNEGVLTWSASLNNQYWDKNGKEKYAYIAVKITGNEKQTEKKRVPLNISLVLDRSGSMSGNAMKFAKDAAKFVVKQLSSEDYLSIVNYDDIVEVTSPSQQVKNKELLIEKIDKITSRNMTNLSGGTLEGYKQVAGTKKSNYVNRVLLLTDGLANTGITNPIQLNKIASGKFQEEGIALSTFGLGSEYDEDLLTQMAESGRGNYYYIDKADRIPEIFAKELEGLLNVVAQNTAVTIELPSGVKCEKVYGYPHIEENGKITVALNDIFTKEDKVFLLKVKIADFQVKELNFPVKMDYTDAETFSSKSVTINLTMQETTDTKQIAEHKSKQVEELIALFEATDTFDLILSDVDKNDYSSAKEKASSAIIRLKAVQKDIPSEELNKQEVKMQEYLDNMDEVQQMNREDKMILQKSVKSLNYETKKMKK